MTKKITTELYLKEFSIENNPYYPDVDYVVVSPVRTDEALDLFIHEFMLNSTKTTFRNGFIIPKSTFNQVLYPLFREIEIHNKDVSREERATMEDIAENTPSVPEFLATPIDKYNELWKFFEGIGNPFVCDDDRMEISIMIGPIKIALQVLDNGLYEVKARKFTAFGKVGFNEKLKADDLTFVTEQEARTRFYILIHAFSEKMVYGVNSLDKQGGIVTTF